ncbi:citrate-binding protein-like [Phragmites australis]|uniref:citrate-binding protein-like n=1 Tax=Phragmites australis TaxID=29695 RepID=UPI002D777BCD|nr:citrate-binding protein-like [Phragmites australis]
MRLTEINQRCHDYSSGVWQFEAYGYVPSGTSGACVMQIHNEDGGARATAMMLHVYNGTLRYYSGEAVEDCIYDRWFRLNVVHDLGASTVAVYVDGVSRLAVAVRPSLLHYFKFGVYMQGHDQSERMESRWRNVSVYTKPPSPY